MWWLSIPSNRTRLYKSIALSLLIVGASFFALLSVIYMGLRVFQVILPGVRVGKQDLSFKTVEAAIPLLEESAARDYPIVLFTPGWFTTRNSVDLGLQMEADSTALDAYEASYGGGFWKSVSRLFGLADTVWIVPVVNLDENVARAGLQSISQEANIVPQEARFSLEGGQIVAEPGIFGRTLDIESTFNALEVNPVVTFLSGYLPTTLTAVVPAIAEIPPEVLAQAQDFVSTSVQFKAYDPLSDTYFDWPVPPETLASAIRLQFQDGRVVFATDAFPLHDEIANFNNSFAPDRWLEMTANDELLAGTLAGDPAAIFTVRHAPTSYTVQQGDTLLIIAWRQGIPLWRILQANPGIDPDNLLTGTTLLIPSKDDLIDLPIIFGKRILVDLTDQHLWAFEGDQLVFSEIISTGIDRSPTQPGIFQVRSHVENAYASVWDLYMPNFIGIYEAWPGFENGFHGLPLLQGGQVLWRGNLGRPVSFGCIIMDSGAAKSLYTWAEEGVIVEIRE